jgi:hypothetical protein
LSRAKLLIFFLALLPYRAYALNEERASFNYMLYCQGCHTADAMGHVDRIPRMNGYVGNFLKVDGGREYLSQVPGAANASVDDIQLAELLNWIILNYSGDSLPGNFEPYTSDEVAALRQYPLMEVVDHRAQLVNKINALVID